MAVAPIDPRASTTVNPGANERLELLKSLGTDTVVPLGGNGQSTGSSGGSLNVRPGVVRPAQRSSANARHLKFSSAPHTAARTVPVSDRQLASNSRTVALKAQVESDTRPAAQRFLTSPVRTRGSDSEADSGGLFPQSPPNGNPMQRLTADGLTASQATQLIESTRTFVGRTGSDPASGFGAIVKNNALTILGEAHDQNGRFLTGSLIKQAVSNGANVLFIEAGPEEQAKLDKFMKTGNVSDLPVAFGGGQPQGAAPNPYDQEYVQGLQYAREKGVKLVAVDQADSLNHSVQERNETMAANIANYYSANPNAKGVFIVGQGHMTGARDSVPVQNLLNKGGVSTAQVFRESNDDVVSTGNRIPYSSDTATAVVLDVNRNKPVILPVAGNPLEASLQNKHPGNPSATFVLHYPYFSTLRKQ
jgi:hypothetical protein